VRLEQPIAKSCHARAGVEACGRRDRDEDLADRPTQQSHDWVTGDEREWIRLGAGKSAGLATITNSPHARLLRSSIAVGEDTAATTEVTVHKIR
jgi:hypothetical protein